MPLHPPGRTGGSARVGPVRSGSWDRCTKPSMAAKDDVVQKSDTHQRFVLAAAQHGGRPYRRSHTSLW